MSTTSTRSGVGGNQRYRRGVSCPICGGSEDDDRGSGTRCFGYIGGNGDYAHCTREEKAGGLALYPNSQTYAHKLKGECKCGVEHGPADPVKPRRVKKSKEPIERTYDYLDESGTLLFQVVRFKSKDFIQRRPNGKGGWEWNLKDTRRVLYRLPELVAADLTLPVFVVEGEKDVENLRAVELVATCNPMGAKKWRDEYSESLADRIVCLIGDNDKDGREHVEQVAGKLAGIAREIRVLDLAETCRRLGLGELAEKGDVSDFLAMGGTADALLNAFATVSPLSRFQVGEQPSRTGLNGRVRVDGDGASAAPPMGGGNFPGSAPPTNGRGDHRPVADADFPVNEAPDDPHRLARAVLAEFAHRDGPTLAWYRETFFVWDGASYRDDPDLTNRIVVLVKAEVDRQNRAALQAFHKQAEQQVMAPSLGRPSKPPVAPKVTRQLVADVLQALGSMTSIAGQDAEPPFWIKSRPDDPPPAGIVAAANGLVVLDADGGPALRPHTPRFFSTFALPYQYDPGAPEPSVWLKFLDDLWAGDPASVRELRKWFGYALTPDVSHQKILLLIGSPGSGRSTIKDVLSGVVGRRNVASTSAVALADRFGLEPIMGKTLAILGDARAGDSHDTAVMMDRLLRISGGDPVEVNRKGRPMLHDVLLHARLVIVSNEMPNFRDSSKAIVRRYLPLCTPRSFEGREDRSLPRRLAQELPGLLNWAIAGRAQLAEDGGFITPASAEDLIADAKALASPVSEFVAEECVLGPDQDVTVEEIWNRWKEWALRNGHQPSHKHLFGRNLKAATGYKIKQVRPRSDDARVRTYTGIGLRVSQPF
jgi:P4 family phage/plasmid primase-like protien